MEIHELTAFVKVVQTGSFTKAASVLGTQKAQLSRVISHLEAKLAVRLLERTTRSLSLTEIGREIFERAIGILASIEETKRVAVLTQEAPRGVLKLTCGTDFGMLFVSDWVAQFLQKHEQISIEADWNNYLVDLVHHGYDLAIRLGDMADSSLAARKLGEVHYGLFATPSYLRQHTAPNTALDLKHHPLLMFTGGDHKQGWQLKRGGETLRIPPQNSRYRVNNTHAVRDAALADLGIAKLPLKIATPLIKAKKLQAVLTDWTISSVPVYAVFPSSRYLTPKVRQFIDFASDCMKG